MQLTEFLVSSSQTQFENAALLLRKIELWMRLSRTEAAHICRFNPATVTALSSSLMAAGLIRECGRAQSGTGRKAIFLELEPTAGLCATLLVQRKNCRLTLHNLHHEITSALLLPAPDAISMDALCEQIHQHLLPQCSNGLLGLCVVCGRDFINTDYMSQLIAALRPQCTFPIHGVTAESMTCLTEGQLHFPEATANIVTLSISAHTAQLGVLCGERLLFKGLSSGTLGNSLDSNQPLQAHICLNAIVTCAFKHLLTHPQAAFQMNELMAHEKPHAYVCDLARAGDEDAIEIINDYANALGGMLINLHCLYAPDLLVLEGDVVALLDVMNGGLSKRLHAAGQDLPITTATLGKLSPAYGASRYCLQYALKGEGGHANGIQS